GGQHDYVHVHVVQYHVGYVHVHVVQYHIGYVHVYVVQYHIGYAHVHVVQYHVVHVHVHVVQYHVHDHGHYPAAWPPNWCIDFDHSLLDKSSKAYCKKQEMKAYYHTLWEQRSGAVSGKRIANISISSVMFLLWGILGATSLVAWRRGTWSRPAPISDPGDGFLVSETDSFLSSDGLVA
ncbi:unnamed protein product, partial [Polarella glacialis]